MAVLAALRLQVEWGADEALEAAPIDRLVSRPQQAPPPFSASEAAPEADISVPEAPVRPAHAAIAARAAGPPAIAARAAGPPAIAARAAGPPAIVSRAEEVARRAATPASLRDALAAFTDCPLAATATNLVFADGNPGAGLVLVGEAPGAEEDLAGRPFVGPSGKLLDRMLASIGLTRERDVLITNLVPWRPPGNRPPTDTELATCLPFLHRHLALLQPKVVVTLGALSTRMLTGRDEGIRRQRGRWLSVTIPGLSAPVALLPMLHPAYLLRASGAKKDAWQDLIALRRYLDKNS